MPEVKPPEETTTQIYDRNCMEYGKFIAIKFQEGRVTLDLLSGNKGIRGFLVCCYAVMLKYEMCERLENVNTTLKQEWWNMANEHKGEMVKSDMIEFCKCLLVIETLI